VSLGFARTADLNIFRAVRETLKGLGFLKLRRLCSLTYALFLKLSAVRRTRRRQETKLTPPPSGFPSQSSLSGYRQSTSLSQRRHIQSSMPSASCIRIMPLSSPQNAHLPPCLFGLPNFSLSLLSSPPVIVHSRIAGGREVKTNSSPAILTVHQNRLACTTFGANSCRSFSGFASLSQTSTPLPL